MGETYLHTHPSDVDVMLLIGLMMYQQKNFTEASLIFNQVLTISPHYLDAKLGLIRAQIAMNHYEVAKTLLNEATTQAQNDPRVKQLQVFFNKIPIPKDVDSSPAQSSLPKIAIETSKDPLITMRALRKQGQLSQAIQIGETYLNEHPRDVDVLLLIGLMAYQNKDFTRATVTFNQVLSISPNYVDAKLGLIRTLLAQKDIEKAKRLLVDVSKQAPDNVGVKQLQVYFKTISSQINPALKAKVIPTAPRIDPLKKIQALKNSGQLDEALEFGKTSLIQNPKNTDVMLIIGLILSQKKEYSEARLYLNRLLAITPTYLDAKLALINIAISQHQFQEASALISQANKQAPNDPRINAILTAYKNAQNQNTLTLMDNFYKLKNFNQAKRIATQYLEKNPYNIDVRLKLGQLYLAEKKYPEAKTEFQIILFQHPNNINAMLAYIDEEMAAGHEITARNLVRQGLLDYPNSPEFLLKRASIYLIDHQYARAASEGDHLLTLYPENKGGKALLKEVKTINPHFLYGLNEVGVYSVVDYVSDLKQVWQYSSAYYNRDTPWGLASLTVNDATRFGVTANQVAVNLSPVITKNLYFDLYGAYANQPLLFANYAFGVEGHNSSLPVELSLGYMFSSILPQLGFSKYTGSISKEVGSYWLSFRTNFYMPLHGPTSQLYTATFIRYFGPKDCYVNLTLGSGTTPDLADLLTVDFIVIKNNFINLNVQFPLINHSLLLNIGGNYQHWVFPSQLVRNLSGGSVGLNYRF